MPLMRFAKLNEFITDSASAQYSRRMLFFVVILTLSIEAPGRRHLADEAEGRVIIIYCYHTVRLNSITASLRMDTRAKRPANKSVVFTEILRSFMISAPLRGGSATRALLYCFNTALLKGGTEVEALRLMTLAPTTPIRPISASR